MKFWKSNSLRFFVVCFALIGTLGMAIIYASEKPRTGEKPTLRRIAAKFKGSEGSVEQNIETQMVFQPSKKAEMTASVKSGNKTYSLEMTVSSIFDSEPPWHVVEAKFVEKIGNAKPQTLRHMHKIKTPEGVPVEVEMRTVSGEGFTFEILIEPMK